MKTGGKARVTRGEVTNPRHVIASGSKQSSSWRGMDCFVASGSYELEVAMKRVASNVHLAPLYDPKMERVKV